MISAVHRAVGADFLLLPPAVQRAHDNAGFLVTSGTAQACIAAGWHNRLLCAALGFPRNGAGQPVTVTFATDTHGVDRWNRNFAGRRYHSRLHASPRRGLLVERQGPFTNIFEMKGSEAGLSFRVVGFRVLGIPIPGPLRASCEAFESEQDGIMTFDISIGTPLGPLIRYLGNLRPAPSRL